MNVTLTNCAVTNTTGLTVSLLINGVWQTLANNAMAQYNGLLTRVLRLNYTFNYQPVGPAFGNVTAAMVAMAGNNMTLTSTQPAAPVIVKTFVRGPDLSGLTMHNCAVTNGTGMAIQIHINGGWQDVANGAVAIVTGNCPVIRTAPASFSYLQDGPYFGDVRAAMLTLAGLRMSLTSTAPPPAAGIVEIFEQ